MSQRKDRRPPAAQSIREAKASYHARWAKQIRAAALERTAVATRSPNVATAFEGLDRNQQWAIVCDIVATRTGELLRAYPDALDIVAGHRRRGTRIEPEFCVKFLVRTKWPRRKPGPKHRQIPARLLTSALIEGKHRLYSVPTDIEKTNAHAEVHPHGEQVIVQLNGASERGMLACALRRPPDTALFALGCRHVLSLTQSFPNGSPTNIPVQLGNVTALGTTSGIEGLLRDASVGPSFDAQLVEVPDINLAALRRALSSLEASVIAQDTAPPAAYVILTPEGAIGASFSSTVIDRKSYQIGTRWIEHHVLIEMQPERSLKPGYSGSPVVSEDRTILFGMHVAGTAGVTPALAYMIPAWLLFDPTNYTGISPTEDPWLLESAP